MFVIKKMKQAAKNSRTLASAGLYAKASTPSGRSVRDCTAMLEQQPILYGGDGSGGGAFPKGCVCGGG